MIMFSSSSSSFIVIVIVIVNSLIGMCIGVVIMNINIGSIASSSRSISTIVCFVSDMYVVCIMCTYM